MITSFVVSLKVIIVYICQIHVGEGSFTSAQLFPFYTFVILINDTKSNLTVQKSSICIRINKARLIIVLLSLNSKFQKQTHKRNKTNTCIDSYRMHQNAPGGCKPIRGKK